MGFDSYVLAIIFQILLSLHYIGIVLGSIKYRHQTFVGSIEVE